MGFLEKLKLNNEFPIIFIGSALQKDILECSHVG